jgi:hypothetical protein
MIARFMLEHPSELRFYTRLSAIMLQAGFGKHSMLRTRKTVKISPLESAYPNEWIKHYSRRITGRRFEATKSLYCTLQQGLLGVQDLVSRLWGHLHDVSEARGSLAQKKAGESCAQEHIYHQRSMLHASRLRFDIQDLEPVRVQKLRQGPYIPSQKMVRRIVQNIWPGKPPSTVGYAQSYVPAR